MHDSGPTASGDAGFTLLEVLAAVAIAGFMLSAIGSVVAVTFAGVRTAADRVALTRAGQSLLASLPVGAALKPGTTTGTLGTIGYAIDVVALRAPAPAPSSQDTAPVKWRPAAVTITARDRFGRKLRLDTVGLLPQNVAP